METHVFISSLQMCSLGNTKIDEWEKDGGSVLSWGNQKAYSHTLTHNCVDKKGSSHDRFPADCTCRDLRPELLCLLTRSACREHAPSQTLAAASNQNSGSGLCARSDTSQFSGYVIFNDWFQRGLFETSLHCVLKCISAVLIKPSCRWIHTCLAVFIGYFFFYNSFGFSVQSDPRVSWDFAVLIQIF